MAIPRSMAIPCGGMDRGILLLLLVSAVGFALLLSRDTSYVALFLYVAVARYMALPLAIHLGTVMAVCSTLPYGKFAQRSKQVIYRSAALLKFKSRSAC